MKQRYYRGWRPLLMAFSLAALSGGTILTGCNGGGSGPLGSSPVGTGGGAGGGTGGVPGGGGNAGPSVINSFTVNPSTAAPGAVVTLQGVRLNAGDPVTVKFGEQETFIYSREGDAQVIVPPFVQNGQLAPPAAPVPITVALGTTVPKAATNTFTVKALPLAPGTTDFIIEEMSEQAKEIERLGTAMLALTEGEYAMWDREGIVGLIALARAQQNLINGSDNPNSLKAVLDGTAPIVEGAKLPRGVLDAMLAQGPAVRRVSNLNQQLVEAVREVNPRAVFVRSTRTVAPRLSSMEGGVTTAYGIHSQLLTPGQRALSTIKFHQRLKTANQVLDIFGPAYDMFATTATIALTPLAAIPGPNQPVAAATIAVLKGVGATTFIVSKITGALAAALPGQVSGFYVHVNGAPGPGRPGYRPPTIGVGQQVAVDFYVVPRSPGGFVLTYLEVVQGLGLWKVKLPAGVADKLRDDVLKEVTDILLEKLVAVVNHVWASVGKVNPPSKYVLLNQLGTGFPQVDHKPVRISDSARYNEFVSLSTTSTQIIEVLALKQYAINGKNPGTNAGYVATLKDADLAAAARDGGASSRTSGTVNVTQEQVTPAPGSKQYPYCPFETSKGFLWDEGCGTANDGIFLDCLSGTCGGVS